MGISQTIYPGWPWTVILPISASQVARIKAWATSAQLVLYFKDKLESNTYMRILVYLLFFTIHMFTSKAFHAIRSFFP
jgi:hypothetical protein